MATVRKNITLKEEEVIIFNDYCKKTGQTLSELLRNSALKFIKEVEEMDLAEYIKLNCKEMDKIEGEEIAKIIKNIETDKDDKGVEITLDEILQGNL
ncbi:CopG family transcriptional regulator [Fusobacterium animalis]|uniref:CopG family transcriptional regulator n=1 Tax=Fusobacterium animalis TaxID=76859 RepID=UPI0030D50AD3